MDSASASTGSRPDPLDNTQASIQKAMPGKRLLLLQSPRLAYKSMRPSISVEDPKRQELDAGFDKLFPDTSNGHGDRVLPPPRRAFRKSRRGCSTCKARKVKVSIEAECTPSDP